MHLLVIVLNQTERLTDVIEALKEAGVQGLTILDSVGVGRTTIHDFPMVGLSLRKLIEGGKPHNKTIFTVIQSEEKLTRAIEYVEKALGGMYGPGSGILFATKIDIAKGLDGSS